MKYLLLALTILSSTSTFADSKDEKVRKLFEVQGVTETVRLQLEEGRARVRQESQQMLDQMLNQMTPSEKFRQRMNLAADKFITTLQPNRTAEEIVEALTQYYAPNFTEPEIDRLIEFYSSGFAKKDTEVSRSVWHQIDGHFKESNDKLRTVAVNEFVRDLQVIALECKCAKRK